MGLIKDHHQMSQKLVIVPIQMMNLALILGSVLLEGPGFPLSHYLSNYIVEGTVEAAILYIEDFYLPPRIVDQVRDIGCIICKGG